MERSEPPVGYAPSVPGQAGTPEAGPPRASFGRELVALAGLVALPLLVYYLWLCVSDRDNSGALFVPTLADFGRIPLPTWEAALVFGAWMAFQALLYQFLPGPWVQGAPLADGRRLRYRLNGLSAFVISILACWTCGYTGLAGKLLHDQLGPLLTTVNLFAFALALLLLLFGNGEHASRRHPFYAYFMGIELNPRIGTFDLKFFLESRPGLIGWAVLNLYFLTQQMPETGYGAPTVAMVLVVAFQVFYVADYFANEEKILSTMDIRHEKLGWMLVWGDLVWVPFTYTLQAHYLVRHTHELPYWAVGGIVALNVVGYIVFRGANSQKHRFRKDPGAAIWGKPPEIIRTAQDSLLLTSGWWGLARHINYLGDLMMALAWCLPCGFDSPLPYFYVAYFLILLIHRERRDNAACQAKYGADWDAYCRKVPWRIIPYVY